MKLIVFGNQPIITPRDPQLPMEAANKNYVDSSIFTLSNTLNLRINTVESAFNTQLLSLTTGTQTQLNSKLNLSGGTMTGPLMLAANPLFGLEAATKQYTDAADALRVLKAGDTMTGPLVLAGNPITNLDAAPKQYVDSTLSAHAADDTRHLTSAQNTFLDAVTVSATEVNQLTGLASNVQGQINTKFDRAGGLITGDITLDTGRTIFVSKIPASGTEVVNKSYVDSLVAGQKWEHPVTDINLISDNLNTPPASPVIEDVYIVGAVPTGAWVGRAGRAVFWNGTVWVELQARAVAVGDRFGVSLTSSTVPAGGLVGRDGRIVTIVSATPGALTYSEDILELGSTTLVFDPQSSKFGVTYTRTDEGVWVPTNTSVNLTAGSALSLSGNILNVNHGAGLAVNADVLEVNLDTAGGLEFLAGRLQVNLDGTTLTSTSNGVRVSDSVIANLNDKLSRTEASSVTGAVSFDGTGTLRLNVTPVVAADAVNKGYVDTADVNLQSQVTTLQSQVTTLNVSPVTRTYVDAQDALRVLKAGDTMTGPLVLSGNPVANLDAAPKQYVDTTLNTHATDNTRHLTAAQNTFLDAVTVSAVEVNQLSGLTSNAQTQLDAKLNLSGGILTGALTLAANPTAALQATTRQYTDAADALRVLKAGDTMTGPLVLAGNPVANLDAAPKQYVDTLDTTQRTYIDTQVNTRVAAAGGIMTGFLTLSGDPTADLHASTKRYVDNLDIAQRTYIDGRDTVLQTQVTALQSTVTTLNADPVTRSYVDTQDNARLARAGGTMSGYIILHADPQQAMHPTTKQYVDAVAQGLSTKPSVRLATTTNLAATYNNGTFGVSATLTGASNGALLVDGMTPLVGDRILVRLQTAALQNGDYSVQQIGNAGSPFILRRVATVDESAEVSGSYFYVFDGLTLKGTGWVMTVANPVTFAIGTDGININQFSGQGSILAGNGLTLTGNTVDINTANPTRIVVNADSIDLATTGVIPGSYTRVTADGYGRITTGSNPNTIVGYGIVDAQPLNANLTSLSGVSTTGIVVRDTGNNLVTKSIIVSGIGITITNSDGAAAGNISITSNATNNPTANTLVSRDSSGNFSANVITSNLTGNASTATALQTTRQFSVSGDASAPAVNFDGTTNVNLVTTLANTGVVAGTYTRTAVDAKGRVTAGSNPTAIADIGITNVYTKTETDVLIAELRAHIHELHLYIMSRI